MAMSFVLASMDAARGSAAEESIALIGGELLTHVALEGASMAVAGEPGAPVIVLDLAGAPDDLAHATVLAVDALALMRASRLVIAMEVGQIDLVVAGLGDHADAAQLLCAPDQAEWISALTVAAVRGDDRIASADEEAERIARLNAEVARIADLLARLSDRAAGSARGRAEDRRTTFAPPPSQVAIAPGTVRDVLRARRLRDRFFGDSMFEDPAWDMLLDLFAARLEGGRVSVSSLCIAAAVAPTTALRWIAKLTAARLLLRVPDRTDRRRVFVSLSEEAASSMHGYVAALSDAQLTLV